eukprot:5190519-Amphidinium_carterae.1
MGRMGQAAREELQRMRGQKKQKPETDIVREGSTAIGGAAPHLIHSKPHHNIHQEKKQKKMMKKNMKQMKQQ